MELLRDMLQAVNPNDEEAVRDEVIVDLASQCRNNQKKLMQLISSTGNEELLGQCLELNDDLQCLLAKFDAIASGSYSPTAASDSSPKKKASVPSCLVTRSLYSDEEEEEDGFAQLARRHRPVATQCASIVNYNSEASPSHSDNTSSELVLTDPPARMSTTTKAEQDMVDILTLVFSANPSPPITAVSLNQHGSPFSTNPTGHGQTDTPSKGNQGYVPFNGYVAPWAQHEATPSHLQSVPQPQQFNPSQSYIQSQPETALDSSSYPPPPWEMPADSDSNLFESSTYGFPLLETNIANGHMTYIPAHASWPMQPYGSSEPLVTASPRPANNGNASKAYVPTYRLFEDLVNLNGTSGPKTSNTYNLQGMSGHAMVSERK